MKGKVDFDPSIRQPIRLKKSVFSGPHSRRSLCTFYQYFDLSKDFGFGSYSTFSGKVDWRFKRKHHLLVGIFPISSTRTNTLDRTFTFQGQTFDVGATVKAYIDSSACSWLPVRHHPTESHPSFHSCTSISRQRLGVSYDNRKRQ
jgi:hypothetical protein